MLNYDITNANTIEYMTIKEAVEILKEHNLWRRDKNEINSRDMINPTILGYAIDTVVGYLENEDE